MRRVHRLIAGLLTMSLLLQPLAEAATTPPAYPGILIPASSQFSPFGPEALMLPAIAFSSAARRWVTKTYRKIDFKETLTVLGILSIFFTGILVDYHFLEDKVEQSILYERLSFLILARV